MSKSAFDGIEFQTTFVPEEWNGGVLTPQILQECFDRIASWEPREKSEADLALDEFYEEQLRQIWRRILKEDSSKPIFNP